MRLLNHDGRLTLQTDDERGVDVNRASDGAIPASPIDAFEQWPALVAWAGVQNCAADVEIEDALIGPPSPSPRQVIAVGFNYASHAEEAGAELPEHPTIFSKLHASLAGPYDRVLISTECVDWEVELAVVVSRRARRVAAAHAWDYVAGFTIGQDISEREIQLRPKESPQYVLGKSLPGFCPTGPALVTIDEFGDPNDLELACWVNGEEVQRARTSDFVFPVPTLIEYLSAATELYPGDLILTGTPAGIGATRTPPRFLVPGDILESQIEGIGSMRQLVASDPAAGRSAVGVAGSAE
jgi:2-keto-4-pentenoate hydratase/2-oxohepta-3-ene-1,7-dioic acid hydratase in catechol pathway